MAGAGVFPKVTGDTIFFQDYNAIKSVIDGVVSTYYGNAITSSAVSQGTTISAAQMDLLRADINKAYKHITGSNSAINDLATGGVIFKDDWNAYKTAADYCETNKDTVFAATQLGNAVLSTALTAAWNGAHTWTYTFTWGSVADANYYFNSGGYFVVDVSGSNSTGSSKDNDWQNNILNAIATQTYANAQWDAGTNISVTEYGNVTQYLENYCQINITKTSTTVLTISVILNDADVGDQTGTGAAVDEAVNTDAAASITRYFSQDAITAPAVTPLNTSNW
jgi:hypothetical protein